MQIFQLESEKIEKQLATRLMFLSLLLFPVSFLVLALVSSSNYVAHLLEIVLTVSAYPMALGIITLLPVLVLYWFRRTLLIFKTILIEQDRITLQDRIGREMQLDMSDIHLLYVYRTPPLNFKKNLLEDLHYWTKVTVTFTKQNGEKVRLLTRGEVLNGLLSLIPRERVRQVGIPNTYFFLYLMVAVAWSFDVALALYHWLMIFSEAYGWLVVWVTKVVFQQVGV